MPGGRAAGADHSGALAFHRGGGIYRKPAFAAADLRFGGDGGYGQRADILLVHRYVVSISGALQFRGGTVSVHGKFQGVHEGFSGNECHQCGGQRALRVRASYGSGRRGNSYPALTSVCGSGHGVPGAESEKQHSGGPSGADDSTAGYDQKDSGGGNPEWSGKWHVPVWKNRAAESGFYAWHGIHCRLRGGHQPGDVSVSAGSGAGTGAHHHCGPVCGRGRTGTGKVLHEKGHCGQLRTVTYHLYLHGGVPEPGGGNLQPLTGGIGAGTETSAGTFLRYGALAAGFRTAEYAACRTGREVYHDGFGIFHVGVPHRTELCICQGTSHERAGNLVRHVCGLDLPPGGLCMAV